MVSTREPTTFERRRWLQFVDMALAINMRWNSMRNLKEQCLICKAFADKHGFSIPSIETSILLLERQQKNQIRMESAINGVQVGRIGVKFPDGINGDIELHSIYPINDDEYASYQFGVIPILVIIGLGMIISGLIMKASGMWEEDPDIEDNLETCKNFVEQKALTNPALAADWELTKVQNKWTEKQDWADRLLANSKKLWNAAQVPIKEGIKWAIPIAVIGIIFLMSRGSKK